MNRDPVLVAIGKIARIVAETLELRDVLIRVAKEARSVLPLDGMTIARLEEGGVITLYSHTREIPDGSRAVTLEDFSPSLRPLLNGVSRVNDAKEVADLSFFIDQEMLKRHTRSLLTVPLRRGEQTAGFVGVDSRRAGIYSPKHESVLLSIADILGLALEHERLWRLDSARLRRLEQVDGLLPIIANALNVREIFEQVSEAIKGVLQHDHLLLMSKSADRKLLLLDAYCGDSVEGMPRSAPNRAPRSFPAGAEYRIFGDVREMRPRNAKERALIERLGIRSALSVPVYLEGGPESTLNFFSKSDHRYSEEDVPVARRIADLMSLALSHRRLADEERRAALLEQRVDSLQRELESTTGFRRIVGRSRKWKNVLAQVARVSPTETTVLLCGESGSGKEVLARMIHRDSRRAEGPFKAINCASLPETLLESELFGHEKGAFTGASDMRPGCIEQAAGGVLFLDEVGEMSLSAQAKLLRVLEEKEFTRVGGVRTLHADIRVVAATNRDIKAAVLQGIFRQDFYYRLSVFEISVPPLRERVDDILPIAEAFLEGIAQTIGRPAGGLSSQVIEALKAYPWPGNVRELRNVLERATILCDGGLIALDHLPPEVRAHDSVNPGISAGGRPFSLDLVGAEKELIIKARLQAGNNLAAAARLLGISRSTLYRKMQKYGIERSQNP